MYEGLTTVVKFRTNGAKTQTLEYKNGEWVNKVAKYS